MAKLLKAELSEHDRLYLSTAFRSVIDLERVGDYAENIVEYADILRRDGERFSESRKSKTSKKLYEAYTAT